MEDLSGIKNVKNIAVLTFITQSGLKVGLLKQADFLIALCIM